MGENQDDMETLMAQLEREYEEEELRKKAEKKSKKKSGKAQNQEYEQQENGIEPEEEKPAGKAKKSADKKSKKTTETKPAQVKEVEEKPIDKTTTIKDKTNETETSSSKKKDKKKDKPQKGEENKEQQQETIAAQESTAPVETKDSKSKSKPGEKAGAKKKVGGGVSALKEALAKAKEKEEELIRQEEEKIRKEEEARLKKLELERIEKEKKEKKKQKEKERIQRLKQEGKYETKEQKEARQRALLRFQAMGVKIPGKTDEQAPENTTAALPEQDKQQQRKPKFERLRKKNAQTEAQAQDKQEDQKTIEESKEIEAKEEIKDTWDSDEAGEENKITKTSSAITKSAESTKANDTIAKQESLSDNEVESEQESEEESESTEQESEDEEEEEVNHDLSPIERARIRIHKRHEEAEKQRSTDNLRSPVICVLGHVDTGKTKILDNLRRTKVQEDEAGGITQQIGATNVPLETIQERTKMCRHIYKNLIKVPGLLIIDTPGHESFKSLRTRGSSLCDIAILVIDIMHGLEPQTIESINILKEKKTPFLVALNKIDRLLDWKTSPQIDVVQVLENQFEHTKREFETRTNEVIVQLAEQGLNAALFYKNPDIKSYISLVPTSAHTSDGIGNLMSLIIEFSQTILAKRVSYSKDLQCTVMEVKAIPGLGTTVDVCLVNGKLKLCDTVIIPGQEGPIVTQIRGLLTPQPNRDLRVKSNNYIMHKEINGAQGVKIAARDMEKAMAGFPLFVAQKQDEVEFYKEELTNMLKQALSSIKLSDSGVFVQASTLGSLEALLEFLRTSKIPYAGINIGPVHKKDVTMASIMLEKDPQYAVILAFDVKVERTAQDMADHVGVKIFTADIIYHLFDKFMGYREELKQKKREEFKDIAVFPFKLKILPEFIFNTRDPIIIGVKIEAGFVKIGSPVCAMCEDQSKEREGKEKFVDLGRIASIEYNHKPIEVAKQGQEVCIKIENTTGGAPKLLGRHFLQTDYLVSKISRDSIDAVKNYFREEMTKSDWQLIIELKKQFQII